MKRKTNISVIIRSICLVLLLISSIILSGLICLEFEKYAGNPAERIEINIKSIYERSSNLKEDGLLDYNAASMLKNRVKEGALYYYSQIDTSVGTLQKSIPARLVLSDEDLLGSMGATLSKGSPLYNTACVKGDEVAVISEDMANKLFMSGNILGEYIYINSKKYRIIGLCRQKNALYKNLVWDGTDTVFIPYKSYTDYEAIPVHTIIFKDPAYERLTFRTDRFLDVISSLKNVDNKKYDIKDFYDSGISVRQGHKIILFMSGVTLTMILAVMLLIYLKSKYFEIRSLLKEKYFSEILAGNAMPIIANILLCALWIAACGIIIKLILFRPFIQEKTVADIFSFNTESITAYIESVINPHKEAYGFMRSPFMCLYQFAERINTMLVIVNAICNVLVCKLIIGLRSSSIKITWFHFIHKRDTAA